jgi:hypothetical protein
VRASEERIAPLHGRTGVSQLHTIQPPTLSVLSSSMRASHPIDERRRPPNWQVERAASCARHGCLCTSPCELSTHTLAHTQPGATTWHFPSGQIVHTQSYTRPIHDCDKGTTPRVKAPLWTAKSALLNFHVRPSEARRAVDAQETG